MTLLYIDTESDESSKAPQSIQWFYNGSYGIITTFDADSWRFLAEKWCSADGIVMFNAPYDLGVLSAAFGDLNSWQWQQNKEGSGSWRMEVFGNVYIVRRIAKQRNLIKNLNRVTDKFGNSLQEKGKRRSKRERSTPVIDLLKLWSIFIDDGRGGSISLKSLCKRELGKEVIEYSREAAKTEAYRLQDVIYLEELFNLFLERVSTIPGVSSFDYQKWADIKTQATLSKWAYEEAYPELKTEKWREKNEAGDSRAGLTAALDSAYFGGITISLYRGTIKDSVWFDLHSAYATAIQVLNTDRYLRYRWKQIDTFNADIYSRDIPVLCRVRSNAGFTRLNNSLKIFRLKTAHTFWFWNFDIQALMLLFPGAEIEIMAAYKPIPLIKTDKSLVEEWVRLKDEEKRAHGKTTLYDYYKFLANTSYGIKAQRNPFKTVHTNLCVAGMITARTHLALLEMVDECRKAGFEWYYSDTDSVCVSGDCSPEYIRETETAINQRIYPFSAECEGYGFTTQFLSLKRYRSEGGRMLNGKPAPSKIKLHGKGRYRINETDILEGLNTGKISDRPLIISQFSANTEITLKSLIRRVPQAEAHQHPFMFHTNIPAEKSVTEWFNEWFSHLDTKTTFQENAGVFDEFRRDFHEFNDYYDMLRFFGSYTSEIDELEDVAENIGLWDIEAETLLN